MATDTKWTDIESPTIVRTTFSGSTTPITRRFTVQEQRGAIEAVAGRVAAVAIADSMAGESTDTAGNKTITRASAKAAQGPFWTVALARTITSPWTTET